jgi:hypothetical protein
MAYTIMKYLRISEEYIDLDGVDKFESNSIQNQRALLNDFIARTPEFAGCEVLEDLEIILPYLIQIRFSCVTLIHLKCPVKQGFCSRLSTSESLNFLLLSRGIVRFSLTAH